MRGEVRAGGHAMRGEVRAGGHTVRGRVCLLDPVQQRLVGGVITSGKMQPPFECEEALAGRERMARYGGGEE